METFVAKSEFVMESYEGTGLALTSSCRKKLDFENMGPFDSNKPKKNKKSMAIVAGTVQPIYNKDYNNGFEGDRAHRNLYPKVPSNTKRNARERKRVRTINDYFNQLQKYLPYSKPAPASSASLSAAKKLSKVETLKAAIEYIDYLHQFAPAGSLQKSQKSLNISASSPSSSSLLSSPASTTSSSNLSTSFTSNVSLIEKLKSKCENIKPDKTNKFKSSTQSFETSAASFMAQTSTPVAAVQPNNSILNPVNNNNFSATYSSSSADSSYTTDSSSYYGYNPTGYTQQAQYNADTSYQIHEQVIPSPCYSTYASPNESKVFAKAQSGCLDANTVSPSYSTGSSTSSDCYAIYNQNGLTAMSQPHQTQASSVSLVDNSSRYEQQQHHFQYQTCDNLKSQYFMPSTNSVGHSNLLDYHTNQINC